MWSLFIFAALMFVVIAGNVFSDYTSKSPIPAVPPEVSASVGYFNSFSKAALLYTQLNGMPTGAVKWDVIKAVTKDKGLPKAYESVNIDSTASSHWKIVPDGKGAFLVCAEMSPEGVASLAKMLPDLSSYARTKTVGLDTLDMQVFAASSTEADDGANLCN